MNTNSIITIDGPASSGKSSIGLKFAKEINYQFVDSGSIYRAITLFALENNLDVKDMPNIVSCFKSVNIEFEYNNDTVDTYMNGKNISDFLHSPRINEFAPHFAAISQIRQVIREKQRSLIVSKNTVMSGRDLGSQVFPNADLKFYITASIEVRAKRRHLQLLQKGIDISLETIERDIDLRDQKDLTRIISPLVVPINAFVIDTSELTIENTLEELLRIFYINIPL